MTFTKLFKLLNSEIAADSDIAREYIRGHPDYAKRLLAFMCLVGEAAFNREDEFVEITGYKIGYFWDSLAYIGESVGQEFVLDMLKKIWEENK